MRLLRVFLHILAVAVLTALTQVGGIAYLIALGTTALLPLRRRATAVAAMTIALYAVLTSVLVPSLAPLFGRVRIDCAMTTLVSCASNRTYARATIVDLVARLNVELEQRYPGSRVTILDANFPFFDGFPLLPHLSHNDGAKIDFAFFYGDRSGRSVPSGAPSPIGYFHFEQPRADEARLKCDLSPLRWNFDWAQPERPAWVLDEERTGFTIRWWKDRPELGRIFLEPYLAKRLSVAGGKVRFQGCFAARHDDHFHVEIR
jgi:hypothetical protein